MSRIKELPAASGFVDVVLLDGGAFTTANDKFVHADGSDIPSYLYVWLFYIHHKASGRKILWDVGLSDDRDLYTPYVLNNQWRFANPVGPRISVTDQLKALGVDAKDIDTVCFSHAHWDHCRPVAAEFPNAICIFGPSTLDYCAPGHIRDGELRPEFEWDARFFGDEDARTHRVGEFQGEWQSFGPFEAALDSFGDGSIWVIKAPGHMPGHVAAAARLGSGEYVLLGGDCCHSREILLGNKEIATYTRPNGTAGCLHEDIDTAKDTIRRMKEAQDNYGMHMALSHDAEWIKEQKDKTLTSILHPLFDEQAITRIQHGQPV